MVPYDTYSPTLIMPVLRFVALSNPSVHLHHHLHLHLDIDLDRAKCYDKC